MKWCWLIISTYFRGLLWRFNELMKIKHSLPCLSHSKGSVDVSCCYSCWEYPTSWMKLAGYRLGAQDVSRSKLGWPGLKYSLRTEVMHENEGIQNLISGVNISEEHRWGLHQESRKGMLREQELYLFPALFRTGGLSISGLWNRGIFPPLPSTPLRPLPCQIHSLITDSASQEPYCLDESKLGREFVHFSCWKELWPLL